MPIDEERKAMVRRLLREVPEKDGRLLQRVFLDEEDMDTVCREFHVDRGYLRMLLFRARQRLIKQEPEGKKQLWNGADHAN